ncbi:MAG: group 1 truncated hemoglobin [Chitinophagales bacterium]
MMKKSFFLFVAFTATLLFSHTASNAQAQTQAQPSLYKRLGGYDAIAAVTDDFLARLTTNDQLKKFFGGLNQTDQLRVRQHIVDFLCAKTGGPCVYIGEDMKSAHAGLNITEADFTVVGRPACTILGVLNIKYHLPLLKPQVNLYVRVEPGFTYTVFKSIFHKRQQ